MFALGQKQTFAAHQPMSALPPKSAHVRCKKECPLWANSGLMHRSDFVVIRSPGRRSQATEAVSSWTGCTPSRSTRHRPIPARRARRAPTFGEHAGAVLARRTATDNDDVVSVAHDGSGLPACSRIMYSAYQLGQSASRLPVRFSCSPCAASARRSALASSVGEVNVVTSASTRPVDAQ